MTFLLIRYFRLLGERRSDNDVAELVSGYLRERSSPHAIPIQEALREVFVDHPLFEELLDFNVNQKLGSLGLYLDRQLDSHRYEHATPINCRTFAGTCVDGVHFSFLLQDGAITQSSPIAMTVPAGGGDLILGESLHEFLCLGTLRGFEGLDQLSYSREKAWIVLTDPDWQPSEDYHPPSFELGIEAQGVLQELNSKFELRPWANRGRFDELQEKYGKKLVLPPD